LQELQVQINGLSEKSMENEILHGKVMTLEVENGKLQTSMETMQNHMDSMDKNIQRNVHASEELRKDMKRVQSSAIGLSGKLGYHSKMVFEMGDTYYQFIMGNVTKYEVRERLVSKGYVVYENRDEDVD
jgi:chromosome segregation ATPase